MTLKNTLTSLAAFSLILGCQTLADTTLSTKADKAAELPSLPFTAESFKAFADPDDYQRYFQLTPYIGKEANSHYLRRYSVKLKEHLVTVNRSLASYELNGWTRVRSSLPNEVSEIKATQSTYEWNADGKLIGVFIDQLSEKDWHSLAKFSELQAVNSTNFHGGEVNVDIQWFNTQWQAVQLHGRKLSHVNDLCNFKKLQYFSGSASYPQQSVHFTKECQAPLVYLGFREARLDNIEIAGPQSLVHLDLFQADIHNIKLHGDTLPNLEFVDLREANLPEDVSQIQFPSHLKQLSLIAQADPATTQLVLPENLQYLNLRKAQLADYRFITAAKNLESLNLESSNFTQWALLEQLPKLKHLSIYGTAITDADLQHIAKLSNLQTLVASRTDLTTVLPLQTLKYLRTLNVENTQITDYENIPYFKTMQAITLPKREEHKLDVSHLPEAIQKMALASRYKKPDDPDMEYVYKHAPMAQYDINYGQLCGPAKPCDIAPWYLPKQ